MFELIISIFALLNKATLSPSYVIIFFQYLIHFHSSKPQQKSSPFPPFRLRFLFFSEMLTDQLFWALRLAQGSEKDTAKEMKLW